MLEHLNYIIKHTEKATAEMGEFCRNNGKYPRALMANRPRCATVAFLFPCKLRADGVVIGSGRAVDRLAEDVHRFCGDVSF